VAGRDGRARPAALSGPPPGLGGQADPVGRAAYLGAPELRALSGCPGRMRALLFAGSDGLLTGGSDRNVRLWDCRGTGTSASMRPGTSYVVVGAPAWGTPCEPPAFVARTVDDVPVLEERGLKEGVAGAASGGGGKDGKGDELSSETEKRWDMVASLAHQAAVVDLVRVEGRAEPLLASAALDGVVKVWR
jgi:hypothetical protein